MKFDESNVINALHTDRAVIGSKGYFSDDIVDFKTMAEEEDTNYLRGLVAINPERRTYPFLSENGHRYGLFYPVVVAYLRRVREVVLAGQSLSMYGLHREHKSTARH